MIRLGLRLTLRAGREAMVRLLVTAAAVGLGVGLLLSVGAMYHGYRIATAKPCWQCTRADESGTGPLLWNYSQDTYAGETIDRLDVAETSPDAPVLPGLDRMPAPGQFYASPAMIDKLRAVPAGQLGDRFPGVLAGTIGPAALTGPDQLAIVIGHDPAELATKPRTHPVSAVQTAPRGLSTSSFYQFGFALGAVALLVPMVVLIGTATRMAAARREERYAAMRLVGATRTQVAVVASVDAALGAVLGAVCGVGLYALLHPLLADLPLLGHRFYAAEIDPTARGYAAAMIIAPAVATGAALLSLLRVGITPLGVARRVTPPAPRAWRVIPVLAGLVLFAVPVLNDPGGQRHSPGLALLSFVAVMLGLVIAGPWLTVRAARLLARVARGGSGLLAARRLADNPKAGFRSVSGLVLAVLVGTSLAGLVHVALDAQNTPADSALSDVLRVGFGNLPPADAHPLVDRITALGGTRVLPLYHPAPGEDPPPPDRNRVSRGSAVIVSCADLRQFPVLGSCPGDAVRTDVESMFTDNLTALNNSLPFVHPGAPASHDDLATLPVSDLLVATDSPATLEKVRTILSGYAGWTSPDEAAMTFGEVARVRARLYLETQRIVEVVAGVTTLIAGCSLAVALSGSLLDRRRPFTLMRVTGVPTGALYRAVLLETALPLVAATLVAAAVGLGLAWPIARALAPDRHGLPLPGAGYYAILGAGLAAAGAVIAACLPLLGRVTQPDSARFE